MTDLLLDTGLNAEQRDCADAIKRSGDALLRVINDVLDLSKVEAGRMTIEPVAFDLQSAVEDSVELLAERAESKHLNLVVRWTPETPRQVVGDAGRLRQVLVNLLGNAVKFTERGTVQIAATCTERTPGHAVVSFTVRDTGIGIPADKLEPIFDKFTQGDASTTRRYGGTGLGLAISRQLAELMGGSLTATSEVGQGSTFTLSLPVATSGVESPRQPPPELVGGRVLLLDMSDARRQAIAAQVREAGIDVDEAAAVSDGVALLTQAADQGRPFRVVLVDHHMMTGPDGTLGTPLPAGLAVVAMVSRRGQAAALTGSRPLRADAMLLKPVRPSQLLDVLATAVRSLTGAAVATAGASVGSGAKVGSRPVRAHVLLAEDNVVNQRVARRMLEKAGVPGGPGLDRAGGG